MSKSLNMRLQQAMTETHHRVKNNLQLIAAMIDMRLMEGTPSISSHEIHRLGSYVRTLAGVHDILTQQAKADGEAHWLSAKQVLGTLLPMLQEGAGGRAIKFYIEDARLSARQGTSLALVTNELVSNALKHGKGMVEVTLKVNQRQSASASMRRRAGFRPRFRSRPDRQYGFGTGRKPEPLGFGRRSALQQPRRWRRDCRHRRIPVAQYRVIGGWCLVIGSRNYRFQQEKIR